MSCHPEEFPEGMMHATKEEVCLSFFIRRLSGVCTVSTYAHFHFSVGCDGLSMSAPPVLQTTNLPVRPCHLKRSSRLAICAKIILSRVLSIFGSNDPLCFRRRAVEHVRKDPFQLNIQTRAGGAILQRQKSCLQRRRRGPDEIKDIPPNRSIVDRRERLPVGQSNRAIHSRKLFLVSITPRNISLGLI